MTYRRDLLPKLQNAQHQQQGITEILSGLYIGNFRDSKDAKQLDLYKITHILSIHDEARKLFKDKKYLIISAADSPKQDLMQFVPACNDFIHAARLRGGHVLVHCLAGISRSVTIAAAYIISVTGLSVAEALQAVRSSRTIANPNFGFQKQLYDYFEVNAGAQKEQQRLSQLFNKSINSSPVHIPGRLIQRQSSVNQMGGDPTNLRERDQKQLEQLLQKYRHLVETGELCAGDCPNDGITCPSGVCRAHLRSIQSYSFLRRGNSINSRERNKPHMNFWSPNQPAIIEPSNIGNPGIQVKSSLHQLPRNRSEYSLPASPRLSRCLSENNKYPMDQNPKFLSSSLNLPMSPNDIDTTAKTLCSSSERLMVPEDPNFVQKGSKSAWGTTMTTIRATRRFSHQRTTLNVNGDPQMPCIITSGPPSPRYGNSPTSNALFQ